MATYNITVTTTNADERGLDFALWRVNIGRVPQLTKQEYIQLLLNDSVQDFKLQYRAFLKGLVGDVMQTAGAATIGNILTAAGVTDPTPVPNP